MRWRMFFDSEQDACEGRTYPDDLLRDYWDFVDPDSPSTFKDYCPKTCANDLANGHFCELFFDLPATYEDKNNFGASQGLVEGGQGCEKDLEELLASIPGFVFDRQYWLTDFAAQKGSRPKLKDMCGGICVENSACPGPPDMNWTVGALGKSMIETPFGRWSSNHLPCVNIIEETPPAMNGQQKGWCQLATNSGTLTCADDFAPGKQYAGYCDLHCGSNYCVWPTGWPAPEGYGMGYVAPEAGGGH